MDFELGTDIVSITRMARVTAKLGISFLERFLLPSEILLTRKDKEKFHIQSQFLCDIDSNQDNSYMLVLQPYCIYNKKHTKICMPNFFTQEYLDKYIEKTSHILQDFRKNFSLNTYRIETIAGFWAAKEACAKALGVGIGGALSFHDICIIKDKNGKPHIALHESKWHSFGLQKISVSISHDTQMAISVCATTLRS